LASGTGLALAAGVSRPRSVLPGKTYFVTRRATRRHFLFRPDAQREMQGIFLYCLAVVAKEFGVIVHAVVVMSDHYHMVVTDVHGVFPDFTRELHRMLANVTKCHRGWAEEVFNKSQTSRVELLTVAAIIEKIAYVLANPVACFAVRYAYDWPGVMTRIEDIGSETVLCIDRPTIYLDPETRRWPDVAELGFAMPAEVVAERGSLEAARAAIRAALDEKVKEAHAEAKRLGETFRGARRATRIPFTSRASSFEPFGERNPTFAAAGDRAAAGRARTTLRAFLTGHAAAFERWRTGDRSVVFPSGTWLMRVLHGAAVAQPP
jgi:REP element-mobilizing transposase RayT